MNNNWLKNKIIVIKFIIVKPVANPVSDWMCISSMRSWPAKSLNAIYQIEYFKSTKVNNDGDLFDVIFYKAHTTNDPNPHWRWSGHVDWCEFWRENVDRIEKP